MGGKRVSAEVVRDRLKGRPIELVKYAGGVKGQSTFKCLVIGCGHVWDTKASNVMSNTNGGCRKCAGLLRVSEDEAHARLEGTGIRMLSYGGKTGAQSKFACLVDGCGHTWSTTLSSITSGGHGCKKCAGLLNISEDEAHARLQGRPLKMLHYGGTTLRALSKFKCLEEGCGREWETVYANVDFNKRGCPSCAGHEALTEDEVLNRLVGREIGLLAYAGTASEYSQLKCLKPGCGHEWSATIRDVTNGRGCPACADYGFNPTKPASFYLYLITDGAAEYLGFGITRRLEGRDEYHARTFRRAGVLAELLGSYPMDGAVAQSYERKVKAEFPIVDTGIEGFRTEAVKYSHDNLLRIKQGAEELVMLSNALDVTSVG